MEGFNRNSNKKEGVNDNESQKVLDEIWESMTQVKEGIIFGEELPDKIQKIINEVKITGVDLNLSKNSKTNISIVGSIAKSLVNLGILDYFKKNEQ